MATATKVTEIVEYEETVTKYKNVHKVVLTLTEEEAKSLYGITGHIGGSPSKTYRGDYDNISRALRDVGIVSLYRDTDLLYGRFSGSLEAKVRS